jgi:ferrous iron transport protein B
MKSIILVGKPNYGKSLLFNQLTGMRQKVANFDEYQLICFPGTYS